MIFSLPFHVARFFRPTVLDVFDLSNTELGDIIAVYGITAMLSYFPGGAIADHFSARKLLVLSLCTTALGGLYMAQIPNQIGLSILFAYWGVTSILLFWAALIRATREWGGALLQGRAFGFLDGGRGLVAAAAASLTVLIFSMLLPAEPEAATELQRSQALQAVIYVYTIMTFVTGILVWFLVPNRHNYKSATSVRPVVGMNQVLRQRVVWLQAVIVICAYCGYKGLDNYALYGVEVLGMNEVESAQFTSTAAYLRPIAAIAAGFLADRFITSKVVKISFLLLLVSYGLLAFLTPSTSITNIIYGNLILTFAAVYGIRGIYFALLEETNVSYNVTGTAVGLISVVGFTPDIFFHAIAGRLLDAAPGLEGHQHFFAMLAAISAIGMAATITLSFSKK